MLVQWYVGGNLAVARRAHVVEHGQVALSGPSAALAGDDRPRTAYLGLKPMLPLPMRVVAAHRRTGFAALCGFVSIPLLPATISPLTKAIIAWDIGSAVFLVLAAVMFSGERMSRMAADAEAQEEGEWTVFWLTVAAVTASFAATVGQYSSVKDLAPQGRWMHVLLLGTTVLASWLVTHTLFAFRYAHEYYADDAGGPDVDGGLEFPGGARPDYWDFVYFSAVLGMTFQVSDVQITSRKLRRLATVHGFLSFGFNTVILALAVNIGANLI